AAQRDGRRPPPGLRDARLLDGPSGAGGPGGLPEPGGSPDATGLSDPDSRDGLSVPGGSPGPAGPASDGRDGPSASENPSGPDRLSGPDGSPGSGAPDDLSDPDGLGGPDEFGGLDGLDDDLDDGLDDDLPVNPAADALAGALSALLAREEAAREARVAAESARGGRATADPAGDRATAYEGVSGPDGPLPLFPLQPPRSGRDLLADHVTAMVCCAAVDTAEAAPGLDWLDGPALLLGGERATDLGPRVLSLVEDGDPEPLRDWLARTGVRPEKPVRLV
ncbi:hypothetical protein ABTY23_15910, partial [Streptomyces sp. NPDC096068]